MTRKSLALLAALSLAACADPAARIAAPDAPASRQGGMLGSGTRTEDDPCLEGGLMGSGSRSAGDCEPDGNP